MSSGRLNEIYMRAWIKYTAIVISIFIANGSALFAQTMIEANVYFMKGELDSSLSITKAIINSGKANVEAYIVAGRSLVGMQNYKEAIPYLEKVLTFEKIPPYATAWAKLDLGNSFYSLGDYEKAKENLQFCYEMNATNSSTKTSKAALLKFGFDDFYNKWTIRESAHFIFHFQDTLTVKNVSVYIKRKEAAFDTINTFFNSTLPKKIDYFVWKDSAMASSMLQQKLSFSEGSFCLTHTDARHSLGHEITHSISNFSVHIEKQSKIISEGIYVYFDLSKRDNLKILRTKRPDKSILDIWQNNMRVSDEVLYPLGGELVKRLMAIGGKEKFMKLLVDQSYENALIVYGNDLRILIKKLETDMARKE